MTTLHETEKAMQNDVPIPSMEDALSPNELVAAAHSLGLRQVRAWVPDNTDKARTAGAKRTKRSRENAKLQGVKQVSVTLPTELHDQVKTLAARIRAGEPAAMVWADLASVQNPMSASTSLSPTPVKLLGWRRWLLRWLLPAELRAWIS
ncbi:hypothetical protein ACFDAU_00855 [Sulfuriferula sp. GW1]|uniref:hypothetical protein n=1 Tax=Sulfuriferula sp. GW1 TaxID=3345111 RepID=UPI0039AFBBDA